MTATHKITKAALQRAQMARHKLTHREGTKDAWRERIATALVTLGQAQGFAGTLAIMDKASADHARTALGHLRDAMGRLIEAARCETRADLRIGALGAIWHLEVAIAHLECAERAEERAAA